MKKAQFSGMTPLGSCSLLTIFGVLCLTVLALLSLQTAQAEHRLSDANAQAVTAWYEADLQAQEIFARLRSGETVADVEIQGESCRFRVAFSQYQSLEVELCRDGQDWTVLRWQAVAHPEEINDTLPLWQKTSNP